MSEVLKDEKMPMTIKDSILFLHDLEKSLKTSLSDKITAKYWAELIMQIKPKG